MWFRMTGLVAAVALVILSESLGAEAQQAGKVYRIGVLTPFSLSHSRQDAPALAFFDELRQRGWVEGENFVYDWPDSEGKPERLTRLAEALVQRTPDVIVAGGLPGARAALASTKTIPVVFSYVSDPVGNGLVENFARPGGNLTGLADGTLERYPKMLQLVTEALPKARTVAFVGTVQNGTTPESGSVLAKTLERLQASARLLNVRIFFLGVRRVEDIETTFAEARRRGARAVIVFQDAVTHASLTAIPPMGLRKALPVVAGDRRWAEAGALITFAPDWVAMLRRTAQFVDKILRGTTPQTLPVEDPTKYELVVNRKTAQALGLTIPPALLLRADHLIE